VSDTELRLVPRYAASLDRAGHALGAGGLATGVLAAVLVANGGQRDPMMLLAALFLGATFAAIAIVTLAGPVWLALHIAGRRGPVSATATGFAVALLLFVSSQTYGFGGFGVPASDAATLGLRWTSAIATSLLLGAVGGAIGWMMWRIAYRRVG
jgi:hypothetical protein